MPLPCYPTLPNDIHQKRNLRAFFFHLCHGGRSLLGWLSTSSRDRSFYGACNSEIFPTLYENFTVACNYVSSVHVQNVEYFACHLTKPWGWPATESLTFQLQSLSIAYFRQDLHFFGQHTFRNKRPIQPRGSEQPTRCLRAQSVANWQRPGDQGAFNHACR